MESDLKLKITRKKDGTAIIDLVFAQSRHKKIIDHVSSMSKEELEQAELDLENAILKMERRK